MSVFDNILNDGFARTLLPLGFKKKGSNFFLNLPGIAQTLNVQKWRAKHKDDHDLRFTINIGFFVPENYLAQYDFKSEGLPAYPTESCSVVRLRIGELKHAQPSFLSALSQRLGVRNAYQDVWYTLNENDNSARLLDDVKNDLTNYVLPLFSRINSIEKLADELDGFESQYQNMTGLNSIAKIITYAQAKQFEKARLVYRTEIASEKQGGGEYLLKLKQLGKNYGLNP